MPIVLAQPQPFAPGVVAQGAAADAQTRLLPTIAGLYERSAAIDAGRNQQTAEFAYRSGAANADRLQAGGLALGQQQLQRDHIFQNTQLAGQADYGRAMQGQQDAQLQAWVGQQRLSQQEQLRMQQLSQAVGYVMANPDGTLSPDMQRDALMQLKTGLDPLQMRAERTKTQLMDQQYKQAQQQEAMRASIAQMNREYAAGNYSNLPTLRGADGKPLVDPVLGRPSVRLPDEKGVYYDPDSEERKAKLMLMQHNNDQAEKRRLAAEKADKEELDTNQKTHTDLVKRYEIAEAAEEKKRADPTIPADQKKPPRSGDELGLLADEDMRRRGFVYARGGWRLPRNSGEDANARAALLGGGSAVGAGRLPDPANPPFAPTAPPEKRTPAQNSSMATFEGMMRVARSVPMPEEQRAHSVSAALQASKALAEYGSRDNMPPDVRQQFDGWLLYLDKLPKAAPETMGIKPPESKKPFAEWLGGRLRDQPGPMLY